MKSIFSILRNYTNNHTSAEANQSTFTYNVNCQIVPDNTKGLYVKNGKKVVVK